MKIILCLTLLLSGCNRWQLPYHATSADLQRYSCQRYGTRSERKLRNGFCSGYVGLAQVGDEEALTVVSDVRRGAKATWYQFDEQAFKHWLKAGK